MARLAMLVEDGAIFQTNLQYFGLVKSNIVACLFSNIYLRSNTELENHFVITTAFRTNYPLESSAMFVESAIILLEKRFKETQSDTDQFYRLFCTVLGS